ncbi:uncharacterized protein LOC122857352 [Aphidius gifuensis]|uniref:uncharacterized protein LOC122857352 n=1 Tax=Aphidius gifuensis TaxID=684658 RepID=UPI001CDC8957|nr:uncharacterized protein LOC122857352 [Aphidius gifuensis]
MQLYFLILSLVLSLSSSSPTKYNQRQDGKLNVHAKLENILFVIAPSSSSSSSSSALDSSSSSGIDFILPGLFEDTLNFRKTIKQQTTNNQDKISHDNNEELDNNNNYKTLRNIKYDNKKINEMKLIGDGIENCGPGRFRDRFGICQYDGSLKN